MSTLHLVRSGSEAPAGDGGGLIASGDAVVWMEEAAAAMLTGAGAGLADDVDQFVLAPDLALRGLAGRAVPQPVQVIGYPELVALVVRHERSLTW